MYYTIKITNLLIILKKIFFYEFIKQIDVKLLHKTNNYFKFLPTGIALVAREFLTDLVHFFSNSPIF